jgi:hypothetical protein
MLLHRKCDVACDNVMMADPASCVSLDSILAKLSHCLKLGTLLVLLDACRSLSMTKSEVFSEDYYSFDSRLVGSTCGV